MEEAPQLAIPPPRDVEEHHKWALEIRVRRESRDKFCVRVPSTSVDRGMMHYGLDREQAIKYFIDYLDELLARPL